MNEWADVAMYTKKKQTANEWRHNIGLSHHFYLMARVFYRKK